MFKRVRWMGIGVVAGFGASIWTQRRWQRTLDEHRAVRVGAEVASNARKALVEVRAALADGREAMVEKEADLRAGLEARVGPERSPVVARRGIPASPAPQAPSRLRVVEAPARGSPAEGRSPH